jgi:hypothetical protein
MAAARPLALPSRAVLALVASPAPLLASRTLPALSARSLPALAPGLPRRALTFLRPLAGLAPLAPLVLAAVLLLPLLAPAPASAEESRGQTLYVPCYSQVNHGIKTRRMDLTVSLYIHNVDRKRSIRITSIEYYDTRGRLVRTFPKDPVALGPFMTREDVVDQTDVSGGSGGNFLVRWEADEPVDEPLVETIMIGTSANQGISFTSQARVIRE